MAKSRRYFYNLPDLGGWRDSYCTSAVGRLTDNTRWVSYSVEAVVSVVGGNKLMPSPDCPCKVINGGNGYIRDNSSWIIGRIVRDYGKWMDDGDPKGPIHEKVNELIRERYEIEKVEAERKGKVAKEPTQAGLCVAIFRAGEPKPGHPGYDFVYFLGFATAIFQLVIAAIPFILFDDWGILLVTAGGILLSFLSGSLTQWSKEKWGCRLESFKNVVITKGNGSQHAIIVIGDGRGLDLEDLSNQNNANISASATTKVAGILLAVLWIVLLITATGITENTWYLLAVGGVGIFENIIVAGFRRHPKSFGVNLNFEQVIGHVKVMETLYEVEKAYPRVGKSMLPIFFPGDLDSVERETWQELDLRLASSGNSRKYSISAR
ncbi:hypothetical protein ABW20_dc0106622 [Dactylellina cionopaga]|nr:hypothetical protein ABW20_dc0106622 [Dactylellina cionopaga]